MHRRSLIVFRADHLQHRLARRIHGNRRGIPEFFNLTEHQSLYAGREHRRTANLLQMASDFFAVDRVGFSTSQIRLPTIFVLSLRFELQQIQHIDRAIVTWLHESTHLFFIRYDFVRYFHASSSVSNILTGTGYSTTIASLPGGNVNHIPSSVSNMLSSISRSKIFFISAFLGPGTIW